MFQIDIPKRAAACAHHGEVLTPGMEYFSALLPGEIEGVFVRSDFCQNCWDQQSKKKPFNYATSTWKSIVPAKKQESDLPKQRDERAFYLLKEALASTEANAPEEAFILALYLARRRLIVLRQELKRKNMPPASLYEVADTEEMLCVPKIDLSHLQVETIQLAIAKKLNAK